MPLKKYTMWDNFISYYDSTNHIIYDSIYFIGIIVGLFRFNKLNKSSKIFFYLLCVTPIIEHIAYYILNNKNINNSNIYNSFTIIEFAFITLVFYTESKMKINFILYIVFLALFFITTNLGFPFNKLFNVQAQSIEYLFTIIFFFLFLTTYFKRNDSNSLNEYSVFWIGLGWLLYAITSIISFEYNHVTDSLSNWKPVIESTKQISNYILYAMFAVGFLSPQKSLADVKTNNQILAAA